MTVRVKSRRFSDEQRMRTESGNAGSGMPVRVKSGHFSVAVTRQYHNGNIQKTRAIAIIQPGHPRRWTHSFEHEQGKGKAATHRAGHDLELIIYVGPTFPAMIFRAQEPCHRDPTRPANIIHIVQIIKIREISTPKIKKMKWESWSDICQMIMEDHIHLPRNI